MTQEVLDILSQFIGVPSSEIQDRYSVLMEKHAGAVEGSSEHQHEKGLVLDKSLDAALDSFDNLFCRRCMVFDCRLHGCSQNVVTPSEKQPCFSGDNGKPCSTECYLWSRKHGKDASGSGTTLSEMCIDKRVIEDSSKAAIVPLDDVEAINNSGSMVSSDESSRQQKALKQKGKAEETLSGFAWKPFEKDLCLKGIEIFGKNSCLITRNLLSGLKTCKEVHTHLFKDVDSMRQSHSTFLKSGQDVGTENNNHMEQEIPSKPRLFRKRGRAKKLKYTWKSSGHPAIRKRIADGKHRLLKQYTPCGCDSVCGKQCPCVDNGTCCEKYCGCSKGCKNRFRGCHCAKSQCRSRQCPCFAANRECDPDVCRNCWVSCGDGSLGEPPTRGDGYQCGNMKLLLKQQQRILLSKSSVAGWGAFIKHPVNKNDYLGEYTGEIISQKEADKRGKIYDRSNSSFLFDLNDQCVLDALRKGDKLKFANHSSTPNCYAKVMMVAGDHRVGIFAKEHIEASTELFYDYFYGPDQAPPWARKPEGSSKKDDSSGPNGRARKHQSH
ncbi:[histone H3]-lysine(4) N-trimethyltransferase [Ranunculus cassubicifolius]